MKEILMSICPEWCKKIFNGEKTIEVRKTRPLIDMPFKVYVYETKARFVKCVRGACTKYGYGSGKVIGSFVCDKITRYESEFWDDDTYERIQEPWEPSDFAEYGEYEYDTIGENGEFYGKGIELSKQSCLSWSELRNYVGQGIRDFYGWHITAPKLFDKPKELREFCVPCKEYDSDKPHCGGCDYYKYSPNDSGDAQEECLCEGSKPLCRPPQSWCYVEEVVE